MSEKIVGVLTFIALSLFLTSCGEETTDVGTGTLSVAITDAPAHDATEVWVQFSGVTVKPKDGAPVDFIFDAPIQLDLMTLTGENSEAILNDQALVAGEYNWIRLHVDAEADFEFDSYVMTTLGEMIELEVVSEQGLQLSSGFTIAQGLNTSFVIDWDLNQALVKPAAGDTWFLRPSLRITDETEYGSIEGLIADGLISDASCTSDLSADAGNAVYVFEGFGATTDDIDGDDGDPLTTSIVTQKEGGEYGYEVAFVPPGEYTLAFTCQAMDDTPDTDDAITFASTLNVTVTDDVSTPADF